MLLLPYKLMLPLPLHALLPLLLSAADRAALIGTGLELRGEEASLHSG
jgi:hypothetical protein